MTRFAVKQTKQRLSSIASPLEEMAARDGVELVDWQIIPQSRHAFVVMEYEEGADAES